MNVMLAYGFALFYFGLLVAVFFYSFLVIAPQYISVCRYINFIVGRMYSSIASFVMSINHNWHGDFVIV